MNAVQEDDSENRCGCRLGCECCCVTSEGSNDAHLTTNQIGRQRRKPLDLTFRPAVLNSYILAFDIAGVLQTLAESGTDPQNRLAIRD